MKKQTSLILLISAIFLIINTNIFAQRAYKSLYTLDTAVQNKSVTDTLKPLSFISGTLTLDSALAGGYVCGTNAYNDLAKAQIYYISDSSLSHFVSGCGLYIGKLIINDPTKFLTINLYDLSGAGYSSDSLIIEGAPGVVFGTFEVPVTMLSENQVNNLFFNNEMWVTQSYALGIDFTNFGNNQIGLFSSSHGDAQGSELAWEKISSGQWYSMLTSWPFDADMGIFALINASSAHIPFAIHKNDFKVYPNPSIDNTLNIILFSDENSEADINIFDLNGKSVFKKNISINSGENLMSFTLPSLCKGSYFLNLKTHESNFVKKIMLL